MTLLDRVRRTIRRHALAGPGAGVVAAVSGGSDSVALVHLLRVLDEAGELTLSGIAHFNHQLRAAADGDEQFCASLASGLGVPFLAEREDVAARSRRERRSIEDAARTARHEFFERARQYFHAEVVATGHTRDDQAETFLLRLIRGAGARGLAAMHPRRGAIVRPLLDCRRTDLQAYLEADKILYRHDETNDDVGVPRNRVRAELLPLLLARFNPDVVEALADAADVAREEWGWLVQSTREPFERLCREEAGAWHVDAAGLGALPAAVARMVAWQALSRGASGRPIGFAHVEQVLELGRRPSGTLDLPGQQAQRLGPVIVLRSKAGRSGRHLDRPFWYPLEVPGEARVAESGLVVSVRPAPDWRRRSASEVADRSAGPEARAVVQLGQPGRLAVRSWHPGDRFRPLGLAGRKKLQDFFVDRKVPRAERRRVPLVVDEFDRIMWVAGHAIGEEFRVTDPAQPVLVLELKPLGGLA